MTLARVHHTTDAPFTKNFRDTIKQVLKRLFRVYAHMYYHHFDKIRGLGEEAHINTCFQVQAPLLLLLLPTELIIATAVRVT